MKIINYVVGNCEGGLAELLRAEERELAKRGIASQTIELAISHNEAQRVSDAMHNLGYDNPPYDRNFVVCSQQMNHQLKQLGLHFLDQIPDFDSDIVAIVHDAQAAGLLPLIHGKAGLTLWRHHLGADPDGVFSREFWTTLRPFVEPYADLVICHQLSFCPDWIADLVAISPGIDTCSEKNRKLEKALEWKSMFNEYQDVLIRPKEDHPEIRDDDLVILSICRWAPMKAPHSVFDVAVNVIAGRHDVQILMLGPDPTDPAATQILAELRDKHQRLPAEIGRRVHILTQRLAGSSRADGLVNNLLCKADVFLALSIAEGFGLTTTEALFHATPVVARDIGGISKQIETTEGGFIGANDFEIQINLEQLLGDPDLRDKLSRNGFNGVREYYLIENSMDELIHEISKRKKKEC